MAAICTGADVLARAGLLDGRPATTHWRHAEAFRARHPEVLLDPDVLYVDDGDVLTAAGAASGIDLCLHLVRRDHRVEVANRAARARVVPPHRAGGQALPATRAQPTDTTGAAPVPDTLTQTRSHRGRGAHERHTARPEPQAHDRGTGNMHPPGVNIRRTSPERSRTETRRS